MHFVTSICMVRIWCLFFLSVTSLSPLANANTVLAKTCESHFMGAQRHFLLNESAKLKSPEALYTLSFKADSRFGEPKTTKEDLVDLFQMLGQTQFFNLSEKLTLEKGTMQLAQRIDDLVTAQAEYTYDKANQVLHLSRISLINSKNGQEQALTKEPLDYTGKDLLKKKFNVVFEKDSAIGKVVSSDDFRPQEQAPSSPVVGQKAISLPTDKVVSAEISFPALIAGESFAKINKWALTVPYLKHAEIKVVDSINKQRWTLAKGQSRRLWEFAKDRFFKQAFGLLIIYAIVDGMGDASEKIAQYMVEIAKDQDATVSVKVKETRVDGQVTNTEQKFKINLPKKSESTAASSTGAK